MPLAEPQVPADPVAPQPPLPPAAVDGFLWHAELGSQFLHAQEPTIQTSTSMQVHNRPPYVPPRPKIVY